MRHVLLPSVLSLGLVTGGVSPSPTPWPALAPGVTAGGSSAAPGPAGPSFDASVRQSPPDSAEWLERAREAQARFERRRRRYLPEARGGEGGGCDDEVGRLCWRHDTGGAWTPEPEDPRIGEAREELLVELERVAAEIPGDAWVLGQRVYYLGEAGRWGEAEELARRCVGAPAWWCRALEGLALHARGFYPKAEAAFGSALARMTPEKAREWTDPRVLLDGGARDVLQEARDHDELSRDHDEASRDRHETTGDVPAAIRSPDDHRSPASDLGAFVDRGDSISAVLERMWSLADPLYLVEGNDRRTEHFARRTMVEIRSEARNPYAITWGGDLAELLVRYGWGVGWMKILPGPSSILSVGGVSGHEHPESRHYLPPSDVLENPVAVEPGGWEARLDYARSAYAPRHAPVILPAEGVVHAFPRGERVLLHAAYALPADTTYRGRRDVRGQHDPPPAFEGRPARGGLFLKSESLEAEFSTAVEGREGTLTLEVPAGRYWASLEVWDPERGFAGRIRHGLDLSPMPPDVLSLSDLLFLEDGAEPVDLEAAVRRLRSSARVTSGSTLRVGWEVWGLGWKSERLAYRLALEESPGGFFRRAGRFFGLVDDPEELILEWDETGPEETGPVFRSLFLDLPDLEPGSYRLRLELGTSGRNTVVSERVVHVVPVAGGG